MIVAYSAAAIAARRFPVPPAVDNNSDAEQHFFDCAAVYQYLTDMIDVQKQDKDTFTVTVNEGGSSSRHTVTLDDSYHQKLTGGKAGKEELIRKSFEFLLKRESKESILSNFDLPVIQTYFPGYERKIRR